MGQVGDVDGDGLAAPGGSLVGIEGQEDCLEAGEGDAEGDTGEVEAGDEGEEAEDEELEVGIGGLEGVVKPAAEVVVASAGVGLFEEGGDFGGCLGVVEEGAGGGG